jgi:hypothetical protein
MFQYLVKFIEETRIEQTKGLTEEQKALWVWDVSIVAQLNTIAALLASNTLILIAHRATFQPTTKPNAGKPWGVGSTTRELLRQKGH